MKRIFKLTIFLLGNVTLFAQAVVSAPVLEAQAAENLTSTMEILETSQETLQSSRETVNSLKSALEQVEKVSDYLLDLEDTYDIIRIQTEALEKGTNLIANLRTLFPNLPESSVSKATGTINMSIKELEKQAKLIEKLLTSGIFKMTDAERLSFLREIKKEAMSINSNLSKYSRDLKTLDSNYAALNN